MRKVKFEFYVYAVVNVAQIVNWEGNMLDDYNTVQS